MPYTVKGMDMSFSGLLTFFEDIVSFNPAIKLPEPENTSDDRKRKKVKKSGNKKVEEIASQVTAADLCFTLQETIFAMLTEVTERAMAHCESKEVIIVGGVGCNERLQEMIKLMVEDRNATMGGMDERYCIDNGAMIAYAGVLEYFSSGATKFEDTYITQRFRTDEVLIKWRQ